MIEKMSIYLAASTKYQPKKPRKTCYLLEAVVDNIPYTRHEILQMDETYHGAMTLTMKAAADRIRRPVDVVVYTEDGYLASRLNELAEMKAAGFRNKDGSMIAFSEAWQTIAEHVKEIQAETGAHSYTEWMLRQMEDDNV